MTLLGALEMVIPNILLNTFNPIVFLLSFNILCQYTVSFPWAAFHYSTHFLYVSSAKIASRTTLYGEYIQYSLTVPYLLHSPTVWHFFPRPYY